MKTMSLPQHFKVVYILTDLKVKGLTNSDLGPEIASYTGLGDMVP